MVDMADKIKILIAGDKDIFFVHSDFENITNCDVKNNYINAIDAAAKKDFDLIAIIMPKKIQKLKKVLAAFDSIKKEAKIVVLSQMLDEPALCQMLKNKKIDDYLVGPMDFEFFYKISCQELKFELTNGQKCPVNVTQKHDTEEPTQKIQNIELLEKMATEDELTGLKNRRYVWEFIRQVIDIAKDVGGIVTLLVFDIDDFKHYNDVYSHSAGDQILQQASKLMRRCCRNHDVVARIGGDEFLVVFWDDPKEDAAKTQDERRASTAKGPKEPVFIAQRFRAEINKTEFSMLGPEGRGALTISGGLASFPIDGQTADELFKQADQRLIEAKKAGKNRIQLIGGPQKSQND